MPTTFHCCKRRPLRSFVRLMGEPGRDSPGWWLGLGNLAEVRPHGVEYLLQRGIQQAQLGFFSFRYALQETLAAAARVLAEHQRTVMLTVRTEALAALVLVDGRRWE